jgi:hypothetical protein
MTEKLEKLITLALVDGEISERELEILQKKAKEEGVDEDELEMLLDTRLYERKEVLKEEIKNSIPPPPIDKHKTNKEGDLKKCPSCGAPVQSFITRCGDCGHEFRNTLASNSIQKLYDDIQKAETIERAKPFAKDTSLNGRLVGEHFANESRETSITNLKASIISNFPIPNSKEDILEFLSLAVPKSHKTGNFFSRNYGHTSWDIKRQNILAKVWKEKCIQIIMKARFSMKEDKTILSEIEYYAKELKIK